MVPLMSEHSAAPVTDKPHDDGRKTASFGFRDVPAAEKATLVRQVFDNVADRYDLMNDLMSLGVHRLWKTALVDALAPRPGLSLLDVAGGTGDIAFRVIERVKTRWPDAPLDITVCDINPAMLTVGRDRAIDRNLMNDIRWLCGNAEALPLPDASVDAVVSQFGLMFFDDRVAALREMRRVLRPGGRIAVAVCDAVERSPGYGALAALLQRLFGDQVAGAFRAPFAIGDAELLIGLGRQAALPHADVLRRSATVRFASIDALVSTERACIWTLGGLLDDAQFDVLLREARLALTPLLQADGSVAFEMPALIVAARSA